MHQIINYAELLVGSQPDQERNKLQRPNSGFIKHTPHEAQHTSQPVALTFVSHSKKNQNVVRLPGLPGSNDLRVG